MNVRHVKTAVFYPLVLVIATLSTQANAAIVAHWKFDEVAGAVAADSVGGNNGALAGLASFVGGGISGNAISFTEVNGDLVNMGQVFGFAGANSFTASAWVKTSTVAGDTLFLGKHHATVVAGWFFGLNSSGGYGLPNKAYYYNTDPPGQEVISTSTVNDGEWHQIVGTFDTVSGMQSIYVDGALQDANLIIANTAASNADFIVGGFSSNVLVPTAAYTGLIDDVQIYDEALDANDVAFLFANPGSPVPLPPAVLMMGSGLAFLMRRKKVPSHT